MTAGTIRVSLDKELLNEGEWCSLPLDWRQTQCKRLSSRDQDESPFEPANEAASRKVSVVLYG